jgi:hypothetical protein
VKHEHRGDVSVEGNRNEHYRFFISPQGKQSSQLLLKREVDALQAQYDELEKSSSV